MILRRMVKKSKGPILALMFCIKAAQVAVRSVSYLWRNDQI
jgi:hypothetical protein